MSIFSWKQFNGIWHLVTPASLERCQESIVLGGERQRLPILLQQRWRQGVNLLSTCDQWFSDQWVTQESDTFPDDGVICRYCKCYALREQYAARIEARIGILYDCEEVM